MNTKAAENEIATDSGLDYRACRLSRSRVGCGGPDEHTPSTG